MSTNEIGIEQARKELGPRADAAHHRGEITYLTRYGRRYAAIVPIDRIKEPAMAATVQDLAYQVSLTLGDHIDDFDIDAIVEEIREKYGPVGSIDDIPSEEYNALIERHDKSVQAITQNPTWTARLNVIDGVITVAPNEGDEAHYLPERDGLHIDRITLGPWAEDEEDMGRADAALAAEGLARVGDWEDEGDGYVCAVRAADESPIS